MRLKHIDMTGFKSFADKTRLEFDKGITSIVGPNGCGKSNVVDCVRWCIGEMSWKSLRSSSMVDIIFNGTAKRNPLNMAEVSMVFDNTSKKLPIDFDEVTVTRKVYKSGESEYFLNKVQCRLRDIRDLFLDTGIGSDGYAIIDQGGVNFILKANAVERRELFEEAAGVSKYKAKRDEAVRKLEKVDSDIARLTDTVILINDQIKKLDSEARKARLYKRYKEELRDSEIAIACANLTEVGNKLSSFCKELKPLTGEITNLQMQVNKLEGELSALNLNLTHKQNEVTQFSQKTAEAKYQTGRLEGDKENFKNLIEELKSQIANYTREDESDTKRKEELTPQVENLQKESAKFETEIEPLSASYSKMSEDIKEREQKISDLNNSIEKQNNELMNMSQVEMDTSRQIAFDQSAITHISENLINIQRENEQKSEKLELIKKESETSEADFQIQKEISAKLSTDISKAATEEAALLKTKTEAEEELLNLNSKKAALTATLDVIVSQGSRDPYWNGVNEILNSSISGIHKTLRKQIEFPHNLKFRIEEIFANMLDAVICENQSAADTAIEFLKSKGGMRAGFILLDMISDIKDVPLDEECQEIKRQMKYPEYLQGLINYLLSRSRMKTDKGVFYITAGAQNIELTDNYWGKEGDIRKDIEANEVLRQTTEKKLSDITLEYEKTVNDLSELRLKYNEEKIKENNLLNILENQKQSLNSSTETLGLISSEKETLLKQRSEKEQNLILLKQKISEISENRQKIKSDVETSKSQRSTLQESLSSLRENMENLRTKLQTVRNEQNQVLSDLRSVKLQRQNISETMEKRQTQKAASEERIKEFENKKLSCEVSLEDNRKKLAELEVEQTRLQEELTFLKSEYEKKSGDVKLQKEHLNSHQLKAGELEIEIKNLTKESENIKQNLQDNFQISAEEAGLKYRDFKIDNDKVKMMRRRIENMGAVNMTAPEEYDALSSRHEFLNTQIQDLETAKTDLRSAINKINAATKENFRNTFDKVKENFQKIYQILFEGGKADLVLTDPDNLLETGVEIVTRPPGKRALNISALSGGEQALTALSLLFSFFVVNPSPFCILDEADAPLDEANIDRFVNLVKQFVKHTQFLIVTHNKRTMEAADVLYGITMQESGVSKVVSVELTKDKENLSQNESNLAAA